MTKSTEGQSDLQSIRNDIDRVDEKLLRLLSERRKKSIEAAHAKQSEADWFRDPNREQQLIAERIAIGQKEGLDSHYITSVFQGVIEDSVRLQQEYYQERVNEEPGNLRVAFQGIAGSYSHLATLDYFSRKDTHISHQGYTQFREAVEAVEKGEADLAVLPIENTTSGAINEVYDLLLGAHLSIIGEIKLKVDHCLLGIPEAKLSQIKTIYCHPQTVLQCSNFLNKHRDCKIEYFADTALSGKKIREDGISSQAAIASEEAAKILGLEVLERSIANQDQNFTRFLVASRKAIEVDLRIPCKTSIVIMTGNEPGALLETLHVFRESDINLTKLESRPIPETPWEEMFYVDFVGNVADTKIQSTLDAVTRRARFIKILGSYPSQDLPTAISSNRKITPEEVAESDSETFIRPVAPQIKAEKPSGYRLASRQNKPEDTVIDVNGVRLGGEELIMIAGPCAVESPEQILACAREVKENGAHILRGGCFKPRTSPYSFQGLGYDGLEMLVEAGRQYDLPIITEVLDAEDVARVAETADILQIGARNMQNFTLLSEVGRSHRPAMLKRGMSSSIDELLQAAEYILAGGNQQVFLCERGIRTFETATRNTLDLSSVPILRGRTHLPVSVDPSHAAGKRDLVAPLAIAGKSIGAHAIMVEIHPDPETALSDGPQALRFHQFAELMDSLMPGRSGTAKPDR